MAGALPIGRGAHFDVPLSNFAVRAFAAPDDMLVADELFPVVSVGKQSDKYYVVEPDDFRRVPDTLRAPRTAPSRVQFRTSSESYFTDNHALAGENALEDLANADIAIGLRQNTTAQVTGLLRLGQEVRIANQVTSISNVGSGVVLSGANKWSDPNSDPIGDIQTGQAFIRSTTGLLANVGLIDWDTLQVVRRHPSLLDLFKYTEGGLVSQAQLLSAFSLDRLIVGRAIKENNLEAAALSSVTNVWGNNFLLAHVEPAMGLQTKTLGLRMRWNNGIYPSDFGVMTKVENQAGDKKIEIVEAGYYQDEKIIGRNLGYLINATL